MIAKCSPIVTILPLFTSPILLTRWQSGGYPMIQITLEYKGSLDFDGLLRGLKEGAFFPLATFRVCNCVKYSLIISYYKPQVTILYLIYLM